MINSPIYFHLRNLQEYYQQERDIDLTKDTTDVLLDNLQSNQFYEIQFEITLYQGKVD